MTNSQKRRLVAGGSLTVLLSLVLYFILFRGHVFDPKSLIVFIGFFAMAAKLSAVKHKHNPMI